MTNSSLAELGRTAIYLGEMSAPFLSVENSFTGRRWIARACDERMTLALSQRYALPDLIARSLSARGVDLDTAPAFMDPRLRDLLPDPSRFRDMDKAAARLANAIQNGESVAVFGDYDVDGGTSSALLLRFGRAVGADLRKAVPSPQPLSPSSRGEGLDRSDVENSSSLKLGGSPSPLLEGERGWGEGGFANNKFRLYIPDRMREGYGPNVAAMKLLANEGIKLTICVDCGTTAHEALQAARDAGMDVVVLDHHAAEPDLPPAYAVVNPNRLDDEMAAGYGALAAVGVAYLFVVAVNRALRAAGWYGAARPEPDLKTWLDLVALGTVCDVVKLTGLNRAFVAQGLKIMAQKGNVGIAALFQAAGHKGGMDTYAAGFVLGPRVNAGGRIGQSDLGARLLATDDAALAVGMAERLNQYNAERREIEARVLAEAESMFRQHEVTPAFAGVTVFGGNSSPLIFVASENWHAGVIGIVASRLKDKFHRPAIVVALENGIGKGSGRSVGAVDLGAAVIAARQAGLLINGGGHKMAAGLTVARENLAALQEFLTTRIGKQLESEPLKPTLTIDGLMSGASMQPEFVEKLAVLAPFGTGNPEPRFALADCRIVRASIVGEKHVSVIAMQGGTRFRGIAFRAMDNALGPALLAQKNSPCHLAGHMKCDEWQGERRVQLHISDGAGI